MKNFIDAQKTESRKVFEADMKETEETSQFYLNGIRKMILGKKVKDITVTADTCSFNVENFGQMGFKIIEREPHKTIKFTGDATPVEVYLWIQLVEKEAYNTKMKVTLKADVPFMLKMMVGSKLKDGVNQIATILSKIPY